ncbi:MAG: hypothetical protein WCI73_19030 [Phycisphaerae bacterium]
MKGLSSSVVFMLVLVVSAAVALAAGDSFHAKITKIEGNAISVGQRTKGEAVAEGLSFIVNDETVITLDGRAAKLAQLAVGMDVDVTLDNDNKNALTIKSETNRKR